MWQKYQSIADKTGFCFAENGGAVVKGGACLIHLTLNLFVCVQKEAEALENGVAHFQVAVEGILTRYGNVSICAVCCLPVQLEHFPIWNSHQTPIVVCEPEPGSA